MKICRNQQGKLSLEAIGWMVLALLLVAVGGAAAFTIMNNRADNSKGLMAKSTLICPANTSSIDARQYVQGGVPIPLTVSGGPLGTSGYTIIPNSPYTDINNDKTTAEFVCITNVSNF